MASAWHRQRLIAGLGAIIAVLLAVMAPVLARIGTIFCTRLPKSANRQRLRVALLGAAKIAPNGLLYPGRRTETVEVVAIGARSAERARALAKQWGVPNHGTYADVLADATVDAVYIALITGAHHEWAAAALRAGKHVLCEKPLTSNADEARALDELARSRSLVLWEGFHMLHHPLAARLHQLVHGGELGKLTHLEITSGLPSPDDVLSALGVGPRGGSRPAKMEPSLGGGKFMGQGCYTVSLARFLVGSEPLGVIDASMVEDAPGSRADVSTVARVAFHGQVTATLRHSSTRPGFNVAATFTGGSFYAWNYLFPFVYHWLRVERREEGRAAVSDEAHYAFEPSSDDPRAAGGADAESSFTYQLRAFAAAVERHRAHGAQSGGGGGGAVAAAAVDAPAGVEAAVLEAVSAESAVRNMALIDAIYEKAGLGKRAAARP